MTDEEFLAKVDDGSVSLTEYIDWLNAKAKAWVDEAPGRAAGYLTKDLDHWNNRRGIFTAKQLASYLDDCVRAG